MALSNSDTIVALSSGSLPSGVAVIRISGSACSQIIQGLNLDCLRPRQAHLRKIRAPEDEALLDEAICLWFPGPDSFTGEDCLELQVHGGRAVVDKLLEVLTGFANCRLAEPGEFSRRAFENGKLDLTEVEGLADLIASDTEQQRIQAQAQAGGRFREILESWRSELIRCRAFLEVEFDFSDEDDVPDSMIETVTSRISSLASDISRQLKDGIRGEIVREGFTVVLAGAPNAGKSSLLNALAGRDIAIVSSRAGTTRDVLECKLDIGGIPVNFYDTAGIRETLDDIEQEGIRRALNRAEAADLTVWLSASDNPVSAPVELKNAVTFISKDDLQSSNYQNSISTVKEDGLKPLLDLIKARMDQYINPGEPALVTRQRHRLELEQTLSCLIKSISLIDKNGVLASEELRLASVCLGRLTGFVDVEDLLDVIFSEFCIGK